jgi:RNA polymerase sigma factor (sigma-70 family)
LRQFFVPQAGEEDIAGEPAIPRRQVRYFVGKFLDRPARLGALSVGRETERHARSTTMATGQPNPLLSYIRRLAAPVTAHISDRELLQRFAAQHDENAFAVLVQRHGTMVLNVARRVLHNGADAEDVFQATFLVLLRKAASLHWKESVGNWLYEVAYRLALKAKTAAARRRLHEVRVPQPPPDDLPGELNWRELHTLLDEELHHLPGSYRVPLILCYLEGTTRDEAAQRLGWSLSTLKRRLERGRELLRLRLVRRGLTVSAALFAPMLLQNTAQATLPSGLARATVRTALQLQAGRTIAESVSVPVAALVEGGLKMMFMMKLKMATALLVTLGVFAGAGALARQVLSEQRADLLSLAANSKNNAGEQPGVKSPSAVSRDRAAQTVQVSGRVLDPDGKPVAGAKMYWMDGAPESAEPAMRAVSKADGIFEFQATRPKELDPNRGRWWLAPIVVAVAPGFGPDWAPVGNETKGDLTLRLVRPGSPIRGRVLNLEGQPLAGVTVRVNAIEATPEEDLTALLKAWKTGPDQALHLVQGKTLRQPWFAGFPKSVSIGTDGRFSLPDAGRERIVVLLIEGPTIERKVIRILPRTAEEIKALKDATSQRVMAGMPRRADPTIYPPTFDHTAGPTKIVVGTVREHGTSKLLAGIKINAHADGSWWQDSADAATDEKGRFRIVGLPKAGSYRFSTYAGEGRNYLPAGKQVSGTGGLEPLQVDFELVQGIRIEGRLMDKATGKPIPAGHVIYIPLKGNTFFDNTPGSDFFKFVSQSFMSDGQGKYSFSAMPGLGMVCAQVGTRRDVYPYIQAHLAPEDRKKPFFYNFSGTDAVLAADGHIETLMSYNTYKLIDPAPEAKVVTCDLVLDPGKTVAGTVVDPEAKPLAGAIVQGLQAVFGKTQRLETASFTAIAVDPAHPRKLLFAYPEKGLIGMFLASGDESQAPTVKLKPWGTVTAKLLDEDGKPLAGATVDLTYDQKDGVYHPVRWMHPHYEKITTDKDGRFKIEGVIPGTKCVLSASTRKCFLSVGEDFKALVLQAGETKDLGPIPTKPLVPN